MLHVTAHAHANGIASPNIHRAASASSLLDADTVPSKGPCHVSGAEAHLASSSSSMLDLTLPFTASAERVQHFFSEGFLLFRLAVQLWSFLGIGWRWTVQFYRLILYAILLLPGFIQMILFYFLSPRVVRSIPYGSKPRQCLDLYFPSHLEAHYRYPVVIYVTGGAWTIGYKAWGALLARRLSRNGVIVACLDYRNFPQGKAPEMLEDVNTGIAWVFRHIHKHHGDPDGITLVGQSAGGHLSCLALLKQAEQAALNVDVQGASPSWSPRDLRAYVGVSGAFDLHSVADHWNNRGLNKNLIGQIMSLDGKPAWDELSPLAAAQRLPKAAAALLPDVLLIHGTADKSVPYEGSVRLTQALQEADAPAVAEEVSAGAVGLGGDAAKAKYRHRLFEGKTHTSFLLEDPMRGGRDVLMDTVLGAATGVHQTHSYTTLCPGFLCDIAGRVCPF